MKVIAAVSVLVATGVILLATGVSAGELALFALFELAFVLLPGFTAHTALVQGPGGLLSRLSIGAAAGHAILLVWFVVTAAVGARWALWLLPAVALAGCLALARRGAWTPPLSELTGRQAVALAGVAVLAVALLGFALFSQAPLPGTVASAAYYQDLMWDLGMAAEALHHWPVTTPAVLGEPLRYHVFAFHEMAATSQQTGIDLPVVSLRLFPVSLLLLLVAQLAHAGWRFTGSAWAGVVAAGLVLFVGDLDMGAGRGEPLLGQYFSGLFLSPTQLLGMILFLPTVVVVADLLEAERLRRGTLALLAILLFGCAGAKASILPVLIGGLAVYALWTRRLDRQLGVALGLVLLAFVASYVLLYSGGRGGGDVNLLESAFRSLPGQQLVGVRAGGGIKGALSWPIATCVTGVALMAALAGLAWARAQPLLIGLLVTSVVAFLVQDLNGYSQLYFLWYGFTAGALLSAGGLVEALRRGRGQGWQLALAAGVAIGVVLGLGAPADDTRLMRGYMAVAALLAVALAGYALWRRRLPAWPGLLAASALLTAGLVDAPADRLPDLASRVVGDGPVHREADPRSERGLSRALFAGLMWVRNNTGEEAVLAVNNHIRRPSEGESRYFYYSGLAERRVFIESWEYADPVVNLDIAAVRAGRHPLAGRVALNDAVYAGEAPGAAAALKRRGVDYVLVDRANAPPPRKRIPGRVVFRNQALVVYRL